VRVKELIELLSKENPERIVIMSRDAEGNGYSPLSSLWAGAYKADTTWCGEVGIESLTPELRQQGYGEGDICEGQPAIILSPVN
jgi:hypothetical protein